MKNFRSIIPALFLMMFFAGGVAAQKHKDSSIIKAKAPSSPKDIVIKYGIASFYAHKFNGRQTANGNIYNSLKYTAACNVLPLGIWVKVTNLKNDRSIIVYINDRLHPKNKRLIDLSKAAAEKLGYVSSGLTKVKVEVLGKLKRKQKKQIAGSN